MRMGFEPMKELALHVFQACAFNHSAISPINKLLQNPIFEFCSILNNILWERFIKINFIVYLSKQI